MWRLSTMDNTIQFEKNNIDFLRLILASVVALFHTAVLTGIPSLSILGHLSADFAVKGFFVISGMLVYRSYLRSSSWQSYFEKRVRRIYPGYIAVVLACAFGLFPLSTSSLEQYFGIAFWKYLAINLVFLTHFCPSLPGLFQSHIETAVDGVFWTLKIEVLFYLLVPAIHFIATKAGQLRGLGAIFALSCLWRLAFERLALSRQGHYSHSYLYGKLAIQLPGQLLYFIAGILILLYFEKLKCMLPWMFFLTIAAFLFDHFVTRGAIDCVWISAFVLVFCFSRYLGNFSRYGDFSYGVYIVHWPILQVLISLGLDKQNPALFLAVALLAITVAAVSLWHLVESKWLARSSHYRQASSNV